jgi:hypothetical protein
MVRWTSKDSTVRFRGFAAQVMWQTQHSAAVARREFVWLRQSREREKKQAINA